MSDSDTKPAFPSSPEPQSEEKLDHDEPHTPVWLTMLGAMLFLCGGIFLLATGDDEPEAETAPATGEKAPE